MNGSNGKKSVMHGAWLLTLTGLIAKVLSAIYRVPLQNLVGDTGFYVYQQVYPIYGIGMTFALSGLPNFVAKYIALQDDSKYEGLLIRRFSLMMSIFAVICFAIFFGGADIIAHYMGDVLLAPVIRSVSWMFLWMPILLMIRGVFQGYEIIEPTAMSQVIEQLVRVAVILVAAWQFAQLANGDVYVMGAAAMQSAWIAAAVASVFLIAEVVHKRKFTKIRLPDKVLKPLPQEKQLPYNLRWCNLWRAFLSEGLIICFFSALLVFFQLIDSLTVYDALTIRGIPTDAAKSLKGIYDRGQPLVQLGLVVATAFQVSYLPSMAKDYIGKKVEAFTVKASQYFRITLVSACLATGGMIAIMPQMNHLLFSSRAGSDVLSQYVLLIIWASAILAMHNILQAQQKWYHSGMAFIIGLAIKIMLNHTLVLHFETIGATWATNIGLITAFIYLIVQLPKYLWHNINIKGLLMQLLPIIIAIILIIRSFGWLWQLQFGINRMWDSLFILPAIAMGLLIGLIWLKFQPILTKDEWLELPLGKFVVKYWLTKM